MLLLTGQRRNEVARARWCEFDLSNRLWTIPAERYKSKVTHVVPLSDAMMELLEQLPRWSWTGDFLFSTTGGRLPIGGFSKSKRRLDTAMGVEGFVLHDLRRTVRTRLSELRIPEHVAEMVIGHSKRGLARVYDQHRYIEEMRAALKAWARDFKVSSRPRTSSRLS
jgi:integrase